VPRDDIAVPRDDTPALARLERLATSVAAAVAPVGVLTALLFYFGYASSRAQYAYFGIDIDTVGLGTQDYVMRSPEPLLTPLMVLIVLTAALTGLNVLVQRRIDGAGAGRAAARDRRRRYRRWVDRLIVLGAVALGAGVLLLLAYPVLQNWWLHPLVTPLLIATGATLTGYGRRLVGAMDGQRRPRRTVPITLVAAVGVFWATATVAQWSGTGAAHEVARHLDRLPSLILDTKERLYLTSPGIQEVVLPTEPNQAFRYRYRGLRLLIQGRDRLFLVPEHWSASNSTLMVPLADGSARIQFRFRNQPPR
jgi:hypothetical protein